MLELAAMKNVCWTSTLLCSFAAIAAPDERVVQHMAKRTNISPAEIRQHYKSCDSGVTRTMKLCASYDLHAQDLRLNAVYKTALSEARESGHQNSLIASQRAWLTYRDAVCEYEGKKTADGGSMEGLIIISCKETLTKERADRLSQR
jgi:uncharacterized protein YecT (DUF1311 family)